MESGEAQLDELLRKGRERVYQWIDLEAYIEVSAVPVEVSIAGTLRRIYKRKGGILGWTLGGFSAVQCEILV